VSRFRPRPAGGLRLAVPAALLAAAFTSACGKKGPPLPPLIYTPAPPGQFTATRRGDEVDIRFTVPDANTDGTRPADLERVDVYAWTGSAQPTDAQVVRYATKVGSVAVKAPRDPNLVIEPDEPIEDMEPPQGAGLDQGAAASLREPIAQASREPLRLPRRGRAAPTPEPAAAPQVLVNGPLPVPQRTYVAVGVTTHGRPGAFSRRVSVPLAAAPAPPAGLSVTYDETAVTVTWLAPPVEGAQDLLPSRWSGTPLRSVAFVVDEVPPAGTKGQPVRLTPSPVPVGQYEDTRMVWGAERCYTVSAIETIGGLPVESRPSAPSCVKLVDRFPPPVPTGLRAVGGSGAISLIWEASPAPDLAGYLVLRGATAATLAPLTPAPIPDTNYRDEVPSGARYVYAIEAVDRAGNHSAPSEPVEESAR
jgi:hypothetical protein